ncbi:MAG: hypothetical protein JXX14_23315, partial [Deltaproteobacteria bacterium]|nr:hypothetical protein [Deltaproteobacteria bacterium]
QVSQCAVVTAKNESPDPHHPPETAICYSDDAYAATSTSSLDFSAYAPAVAVDRFIFDMGYPNSGRLGHRRSLLSYFFDRVAIGFTRTNVHTADVSGATCVRMDLDVYEESEMLTERLSAYPPPGVMPHELTLQQLKGTAGLPLQWHLNIQNVSFVGVAITAYQVKAEGYLPLTADTGILEHRPMDGDGIWIQPAMEQGPGEYLVDVSGTSAGDLGYRVILSDCGTAVPEDCNFVTQDCGAEWLGCYQRADGDSYCMHTGFQALGIPCSASRWCKPGLVCIDNVSQTSALCSPYCDATNPSSPLACNAICPGTVTRVGDATVCKLE